MAAVRRRNPPGGTPATVALTAAGIEYACHGYEHDPAAPAYGLEAAQALGVEPERVFKTLVVSLTGGPRGGLAVAIVPVVCHVDLRALAEAVGAKKAALADPALAERVTGYVVGGMSPVGQKRALPTVLDTSADGYETVFVSGGRRGFDIELAPAALRAVTGGVSARIARHTRP